MTDRHPSWAPAIAAGVTALLAMTACGAKTPDYQSILSSSATTTTSQAPAAKPVPIAQYLESVGVTGEPMAPSKLTEITVTVPRPKGWVKYSNPNLSPGTEVTAKNDTYPTTMLMVFKLHGDFDVAEAIKHGYADAELTQNFTRLNESTADFGGFPSSMIEGSYDLNGERMHSYNRVVIPVTKAPAFQRYLVQLTVTSKADQAVADSDDIQGIIDGFTVTAH